MTKRAIRALAALALLLGVGCKDECAEGFIECGGVCVDTRTNHDNCGACGNVCPSGQACFDSLCKVACAPPTLASIAPVAVDGGATVAFDVLPAPTCYQPSASGLPAGASFDPVSGDFAWVTTPDDFGLYQVIFTATNPNPPHDIVSTSAFITVSFEDAFSTYAGYSEYLSTGAREGPVTFEALDDPAAADGKALHQGSVREILPYGRAYRVLSRSALPLGGIAYEYVSRDVTDNQACGSGGSLYILDIAVTDPAVTWPAWNQGPTPILSGPVVDGGAYTTQSGVVQVDMKQAVTLVLMLLDNSNICTVDVYWDSVRLTPLPPP